MMVMIDLPNDSQVERKRMGRALALLRAAAGLTQPAAAERLGVTLQAWQNYEYGRRRFTPDLVRSVTNALARSPEDLSEARSRVIASDADAPLPSVRSSPYELPLLGRVRAGPQGLHVYDGGEPETIDLGYLFGPDVRVLRLAGESMIPYAEPGGFVSYHLRSLPKRNKGVVIQLINGDFFVKRYDYERGGVLYVTELYPDERQINFALTEVRGVYPIGLRTD